MSKVYSLKFHFKEVKNEKMGYMLFLAFVGY